MEHWANENIWTSFLVFLYLVWVITWLLVFWLRPLALLRINQALQTLEFSPSWAGGIKLPARCVLFVGFLNYRPRVLDAWVKAHISTCRMRFSEKPTAQDRKIHISAPVELDGQTIPDVTPQSFRPAFARKICHLLIWGEGGSGKTSLACQIGRWAMAKETEDRLCDHLMLPVLIEQELIAAPEQTRFINAVGRQLQDAIDQAEPIPQELLERLLRHRRVLVIVDHLSEMSESTRTQIQPQHRDFPANAFIVTSRLEEQLGGVSRAVIKPLRIAGNRLSSFMEAYLSRRGKRELFDDPEFFNACGRLSEMVGNRDITVLLAKLYAEQMIASKEGQTENKLPDTIPDLMLSYLNELNRTIAENRFDDPCVHRDAKVLGWECVKETFRPASADSKAAIAALGEKDTKFRLEYMEHRLRLIRTIQPAQDRVKFLLDPLAEYLAGLHLLDIYGDRKELWQGFLAEADKKPDAPEAIKGFLLAVRDCCIAKGKEARIPDFVEEELAKRAGLDKEALNRAQQKQRVQRLINQLALPESVDRIQAAEALGDMGLRAKAAVLALIEVLKDSNEGVCRSAAWALRKIGPEAKTAVPALISVLKDPEAKFKANAALILEKIGPEAKSAVPALMVMLKSQEESACRSAAEALGAIGPNAKQAVPALIELLKDPAAKFKATAASILGKIGPEAKAAVPALMVMLKAPEESERQTAAWALGEIGPDAKQAVPDLIGVLGDPTEKVRNTAATSLGRIGPEARAGVTALIQVLKGQDLNFRQAAALALGHIGPDAKEAVPVLIEVLESPNEEELRRAAALALKGIRSEAKAAVPALIEALKGGDRGVCSAAASALGRIGIEAKAAVPILNELLDDPDPNLQKTVKHALQQINSPAPSTTK